MQIIKSVNLECTTGGSYKEYRMTLEDTESGSFEVIALWGKIGSSLTRTVKFGGDLAGAEKEYAKILKGQLNKSPAYIIVGEKDDGQTSDSGTTGSQTFAAPSAPSEPVDVKKVIARIVPMLCQPVLEESDLERFFGSDRYVFEEKYNGTRKEVMKGDSVLSITNKKGQATGKGMLPKTQKEFLKVPFNFTVDTEDEPVGGGCVLLDLLTYKGKPLDRLARKDRRPILEAFYSECGFDPKVVRLAQQAVGTANKRAFFQRMKDEKAEGIIVKDNEAMYVGGEAGREYQWKHKFQATASFIVDKIAIGGKNNIGIALLDGLTRVLCGKVTMNGKVVPALNSVVEVQYIYAEHGSNKLNQAKYIGPREDVDLSECKIGQLKFKQTAKKSED